jgi:hypothetical protein
MLVGCLVVTAPGFVKSVAPESLRTYGSMFSNMMAVLGCVVVGVIGVAMGPLEMARNWPWILTWPGGIIATQLCVLMFYNIENPFFLLKKYGRDPKASRTLSEKSNVNANGKDSEAPNVLYNGNIGKFNLQIKKENNDRSNQLETDLIDQDVANFEDGNRTPMNIDDIDLSRERSSTFEEKYNLRIPTKHLSKIKRDLQKIYTKESAEIAYDELLLNHKEQMQNPAKSPKQVFSDPRVKYMYWMGVIFTIFAKFTGIGFFQFYCTVFFDNVNEDSALENWGVWGYIAVMLSALVGLFSHLVFARHMGRKMSMQLGLMLQLIGLVMM